MEQRTYSDLDLSFTKHPITKDVSRKTKENAVIASIKNLLQTNYYERAFNPTLGGNITGLLFEPVDPVTAGFLNKEILNTITNHEPRIKVDELQVVADPDNLGYNVTLRFYLLNSIRPVTINLFLDRLR